MLMQTATSGSKAKKRRSASFVDKWGTIILLSVGVAGTVLFALRYFFAR
jgi:hypothetical protein